MEVQLLYCQYLRKSFWFHVLFSKAPGNFFYRLLLVYSAAFSVKNASQDLLVMKKNAVLQWLHSNEAGCTARRANMQTRRASLALLFALYRNTQTYIINLKIFCDKNMKPILTLFFSISVSWLVFICFFLKVTVGRIWAILFFAATPLCSCWVCQVSPSPAPKSELIGPCESREGETFFPQSLLFLVCFYLISSRPLNKKKKRSVAMVTGSGSSQR